MGSTAEPGATARYAVTISDDCIGSAQCVATMPDVFETGPDGFAVVRVAWAPESLLRLVEDAVDGCPVGAISVIGVE